MTPPPARLDPGDVSRYGASLRRLARALVRDEAQADDLVQETWTRALERPPRSAAALAGWLPTVARRLASQGRRADTRRRDREDETAPGTRSPESPADVLARLDEQRRVLGLVQELREPYRTTLYLRYWDDLRPREIARRTGTSVETVKTRLVRGLALLRERLDAASEGRRDAWRSALLPIAFPHAAGAVSSSVVPWVGALVMKKVLLGSVVGVGVVVALLGGVRAWRELDRPGGQRWPAFDEVPAGLPAPEVPQLEGRVVEREEAREADAAAATTGGLELVLKTSADAPAPDRIIEVVCLGGPVSREERVRLTTDAQGVALFADLYAGKTRIDVDRGTRFHEVEVEAGVTRRVELSLPAGETIVGVVRDARGGPIAGAEVWSRPLTSRTPLTYPVATTDAQGRFVADDFALGARLGARAAGFAPSPMFEVQSLRVGAGGARELEIELTPLAAGGEVVGTVFDPDGHPVPGARVQVGEPGGHNVEDPAGRDAIAPIPVIVLTDQIGAFRYPGGLPEGVLPAHATARGWPVWSGEVAVPATGTVQLDIVLERPATIVGTVLGVDGLPAADVEVVASEEQNGGWFHDLFPPPLMRSDAEGRFRLESVPPGTCSLAANDYRRPEIGRAVGTVACAAGETVAVELQLDLGATIRGRVVGPQGQGLVGWRVAADPRLNLHYGQTYPRTARSGEDGAFVVANLDARFLYDLRVSAPGEFMTRVKTERVAPGVEDLTLEVANTSVSTGRVRGRVTDGAGGVPRDVQLVLWMGDHERGFFVPFDPRDGTYDYGPLVPGRYTPHLSRGNQSVAQGESVTLADGEVRDLGVLQLGRAGHVELVVRGLEEPALQSLHVTLDRPGCGTEVLRYEAGRFRSRDLASGRWALACGQGGGWFLGQHEVDVPEDGVATLEIAARRGVKVPVTCRFEDGRAADDAWAGLAYEVHEPTGVLVWSSDLTSGEGASRGFPGLALPDGRYWIEARTPDGSVASANFTVQGPTCAQPVELVLR